MGNLEAIADLRCYLPGIVTQFSGLQHAFTLATDIKEDMFAADADDRRFNFTARLNGRVGKCFRLKQICKSFVTHRIRCLRG